MKHPLPADSKQYLTARCVVPLAQPFFELPAAQLVVCLQSPKAFLTKLAPSLQCKAAGSIRDRRHPYFCVDRELNSFIAGSEVKMGSIDFRLLQIAGTALLLVAFINPFLAGQSLAQQIAPGKPPTRCSLPEPPLPVECKKERIQASGKVGWFRAKQFGKAAWEAQVKARFGERFASLKKAACELEECPPVGEGSLGKRCTFSAFPCSWDVTPEQLAALDRSLIDPLSETEMKEFTALLAKAVARNIIANCNRCNPVKWPDKWRDNALKAWRKQQNLREDGNATIADLDTLRRKLGA
jgi:hypothetical protein